MFKALILGNLSVVWLRRGVAWSLVALIAIGSFAEQVQAQRYKSIPSQLEVRAAKQVRGDVYSALRNGPFGPAGKQAMDEYFKKFYFPRMTQYDPQSLMLLGRLRDDLLGRFLRGAKVPQAQAYLAELTLGITAKLARDNYHPAVRYNATLILGQLDKQFPQSGTNPVPPIVLSAGTNELLELLEANEFAGVKVHPSVKVGALEGLERHVQYGMDAQYSDRVTKAALAVLGQDAKSLEIDNEVNNWMKCQAAQVLARQFKDGPTKEVHTALTTLIADEEMSLEDRCKVSGLLKMITYAAGSAADTTATLVPLGKLTKAVVDEGAEVARDFEEIILSGNPGARRPSSSRRDGPVGPKLERRELLSRLVQIEAGANSLSSGLPDAEKQKLESLTTLLKPIISQSKDSRTYDIDLIREVFKLENSVDNLIASWQPAAAAAVDDVDFAE